MNIAVIGIGQPLRGDDGIGPAAVRLWSEDSRPASFSPHSLQVEILETPGLALIDSLQDCDAAVLVDAVSTGRPAGTVSVFPAVPETGITAAEKTAHGFGVAETLSLARRSGARLPDPIRMIGVEGEQYQLGKGLSESVLAAMPNAAAWIQKSILEIISAKEEKRANTIEKT
jgi:hydrogenase maturation protease